MQRGARRLLVGEDWQDVTGLNGGWTGGGQEDLGKCVGGASRELAAVLQLDLVDSMQYANWKTNTIIYRDMTKMAFWFSPICDNARKI